jgi:integral membrane protein|tara:strand:+ start:855 stop:1145 length:291 start_codon:yes stop_codon:yes gene_type:complete
MIKTLRVISYLEGISYILLLFIAVPLKYYGNDPTLVKLLGMPHGLLFVAFVILSLVNSKKYNWSFIKTIVVLISSIIPFGTFYVDYKYFKNNVERK